ncbi:DsbA family protein [uncultured Algimonas sp.]|uniref:DsbA family protein n=1 Tax=uncultured Algimonas sp. TaxID=1547920 RepID=UPI002638BC76|nr:DsbA family protein [uncultured Algimonas sp.]
MIRLLRTAAALSVLGLAACAQADPGQMSKSDVEEIVRAYLLENPEVIREALIELDRKDSQAELQDSVDAIAELSDQIFRDPRDYSIGPKDAKVQLVEFFDYNCGFCKRSTDWVEATIEKHPDDVRVVFKELPVLTGRDGTSHMAARAALAAARQGKYRQMHFAMMGERALNRKRVLDLAKTMGLDTEQLERDMKDPAIDRQIADNLALGQRIPALTGTPFFIVNDEFVSGADMAKMTELLDAALEG